MKNNNTLQNLKKALNEIGEVGHLKLINYQLDHPEKYSNLLNKCARKITSKYLLQVSKSYTEYTILLETYKLLLTKMK